MTMITDAFYLGALVLGTSVCSLVINKIATRILKLFSKHTGLDKVLDHVDGKLGLNGDENKPRKKNKGVDVNGSKRNP
jgi:hypothetical protein